MHMGILMFSRFSGIPSIVLAYTLSFSGPNDSPVLHSSGQNPGAQLNNFFVLYYSKDPKHFFRIYDVYSADKGS